MLEHISITDSEGLPASINDLIRYLTVTQDVSYISAASTALICYDWFLTSHEEFTFVWRRNGSIYGRILFLGARYIALVNAILNWVPVVANQDNFMSWLTMITIICSELIFLTRTWAIWERSRPILIFLIGLFIACATSAITIVELYGSDFPATLSVTWFIEGVGQYQVPTRAAKYARVIISVPYLLILLFQSVMFALTLYKLLQYRRHIPTQSKSMLVDALWIDGIIYYASMFAVGVLNAGLAQVVLSTPLPLSQSIEFQTVLHSILSTRVMLHTATVLRQDIVDSRATAGRNQFTSNIRSAEATMELVPEDVELQETQT